MTGINALFPSVDARRALKGVRKIHRCPGARAARRRPWRPRLSAPCDSCDTSALLYTQTTYYTTTNPTTHLFVFINEIKDFKQNWLILCHQHRLIRCTCLTLRVHIFKVMIVWLGLVRELFTYQITFGRAAAAPPPARRAGRHHRGK